MLIVVYYSFNFLTMPLFFVDFIIKEKAPPGKDQYGAIEQERVQS